MMVIGLFIGIVMAIIGGSIAVFYYNRIASTLPEVQDLREQAAQFETTRILDREGNILYELVDPNEGKRTYVPLDEISPFLAPLPGRRAEQNYAASANDEQGSAVSESRRGYRRRGMIRCAE